ncbi:hypothetical protein ONE63_010867 [Megalurothrips usitatus]|uniref:Lateral signaling target protein 2 homolog n=1 Tax=Megalurothrips usitatus TaxID=439358 RepID=A0AAV7XIN7_9NEOP|nr:hypothetical protein ONE63_010867 [Megalurothrips usitatus]
MEHSADHQPSSLQPVCHAELYPKATLQIIEDSGGGGTSADGLQPLTVPFTPVCGEAVKCLGRTADGVLALSNYRIFLLMTDGSSHNIPLGLIENLEVKEIFYLHVFCKDARSVRLVFLSNDICVDWYRRILEAVDPPKAVEGFFAFPYYAWAKEEGGEKVTQRLKRQPTQSYFRKEVERLQFDLCGAWRISKANENGELCSSYPRELLVPSCIKDEELKTGARFRSYGRVPAVVWRHTGNGAVLARCSQPEVGWLGWRSPEDEELLKAIASACAYDRSHNVSLDASATGSAALLATSALNTANQTTSSGTFNCANGSVQASSVSSTILSPPLLNGGSRSLQPDCNGTGSSAASSLKDSLPEEIEQPPQGKKLLIMDARSYTTAIANRARGGGCEYPEYYPTCEIQFMNLANIHSIRKSFHSLRALCASTGDNPNWFSLLEGTRWLQNMSGLMRAAVTVAQALDREERPVVVHCSDGWDRTPQIVALAEILLDPYYRTMQGFQVLCEREWLDFGHKFADRCGHAVGGDDHNERCPVFLQWVDCVHQLLNQFECLFEFSETYLVKLVQHTYSNLFGTFLCNSNAERAKWTITERTFSVWQFLQDDCFKNHLYLPEDRVLWPSCNVRDLKVWSELYLGCPDRATSTLTSAPASVSTVTTTHSAPGSVVGSSNVASGDTSAPEDVDDISHSNGFIKTRSYDDLHKITASEERESHSSLVDQPRRCSDSSINVDLKFVNGAGGDSDQVDGDCGVDCGKKPVEEQNQLVSELCKDAMGLELSNAVSNSVTVISPVQVMSTHTSSIVMSLNNQCREDQSDDDDAEITVTTDVPVPDGVDTVDGSDAPTDSAPVDNGEDAPDTYISTFTPTETVPENISSKVVWKTKESFQPGLSVDSSTDTLVAPDQLASHGITLAAGPANPLCNGVSSSHSATFAMPSSSLDMPMVHQSSVGALGMCTSLTPQSLTFPNGTINNMPSILANGVPDDVISSSASDMCRVCADSRKFLADNHRDHSGSSSRYSTPPLNSRTPSGGYPATPATPCEERTIHNSSLRGGHVQLDDVDGLATPHNDVQIRLHQIIAEHQTRVQELERDLHMTRMALTQQVCHQCNHAPPDRNDDVRSLPESACSGEPASAGESIPSDVSWEALEEVPDGNPVLWWPDHAASHCMRCNREFNVVRRRHHCRNCGKIFCSECSENTAPLPSKQVYEPVRVCTACFSLLHLDSVESSLSSMNTRRIGPVVNVNSITSSNGHSMDVPADMAESALTTFAQHHSTSGNSCGFTYAAVASGSANSEQRNGVSLPDSKMVNQQAQSQSRKAAAAYV